METEQQQGTQQQGTRMRAAVAYRFGGPEAVRVEQRPTPTPKADELLVRVHASTVSIADHRMRSRDLPEGLGFLVPDLARGVPSAQAGPRHGRRGRGRRRR